VKTFVASAIQYCAGPDKSTNLARLADLAERSAAEGARMVVLPELCLWKGPPAAEREAAESIPGPTSHHLSELARKLGIHLVAGSMLERDESSERCFNTSLLFGPDGAELARYRKIHLFDVELPGRVSARESRTRSAGEVPVCAATTLGNIGMAICYDLRFPELFRVLVERGAEILVLPSAFTEPTGKAHWEALVRARAIESQCYVIAPNQFGATQHGFANYGHSLIVDPWGTVLGDAGDGEGIVTARLDADYLATVREELPSLRHRRLPR
jgi:predicted amidohydrolase